MTHFQEAPTPFLSSTNHILETRIKWVTNIASYSRKIWQALNLAISPTMAYFSNIAINFGPSTKRWCSHYNMSLLAAYCLKAERRGLAALAGPFSAQYLTIFTLSSGVHSLYFTWLQGETALRAVVYFLQRMPHTLFSGTNLLSGER